MATIPDNARNRELLEERLQRLVPADMAEHNVPVTQDGDRFVSATLDGTPDVFYVCEIGGIEYYYE